MSVREAFAALAVALFLTGCAAALPAVQSGIDGAQNILRARCPPGTVTGTEPCTASLAAYNAAVAAFNLALLTDAVGEDATPAIANAVAALKNIYLAFIAPSQPTAAPTARTDPIP